MQLKTIALADIAHILKLFYVYVRTLIYVYHLPLDLAGERFLLGINSSPPSQTLSPSVRQSGPGRRRHCPGRRGADIGVRVRLNRTVKQKICADAVAPSSHPAGRRRRRATGGGGDGDVRRAGGRANGELACRLSVRSRTSFQPDSVGNTPIL